MWDITSVIFNIMCQIFQDDTPVGFGLSFVIMVGGLGGL